MFGFTLVVNCSIENLIYGKICSNISEFNVFWSIFSSSILWLLWKVRTNNIFQGVGKILIESLKRIKRVDLCLQVTTISKLKEEQFQRFLKEGQGVLTKKDLYYGFTTLIGKDCSQQ